MSGRSQSGNKKALGLQEGSGSRSAEDASTKEDNAASTPVAKRLAGKSKIYGEDTDDDDERYVDYAKADEAEMERLEGTTFKDKHQSKEHSFPFQLHFLLCETEADGLSSVISWQPHGR